MRCRSDEERLADLDDVRQRDRAVCAVRMTSMPLTRARQLAVDVETVVREQHDKAAPSLRAFSTLIWISVSRMPNDQFGIIQRGFAIGV